MKSMIVTTPIRPIPTDFPPIGSLSIISYLKRKGVDEVEFYHIDGNRPDFNDAVAHIVAANPDVLGISAVVSTAYAYSKDLSLAVKEQLPETLIVLGGNLAASAEIILRYSGVDMCVIGEGEWVMHEIVKRAEKTRTIDDFKDIPGLVFIDSSDTMINTGYPPVLGKSEIYDIDWEILANTSSMDFYIGDMEADERTGSRFAREPRARETHRRGKKFMMIPGAKGCVARCTFCHRWDKGIRYIPPAIVIERLEALIEKYNLGFISVADENFGTDRKWLKEFCARIKPLDILWMVGGMRVNCIAPERITMMKDAGCVGILYGMETGSPRMLEIMEKKTKVEENVDAMRWTIEAGLFSIVQLVIGMPGECAETIDETIAFCQKALTVSPTQNPNDLSINYAQALPGTSLYEYARHNNLIGRSLSEEQKYLLRISDKDAHDEFMTLNFTDSPTLEHQSWRPRITIETNHAYIQEYGLEHYKDVLLNDIRFFTKPRKDEGYFANPKRLVDTSLTSDRVNTGSTVFELESEAASLPSLFSLFRKGQLGLAMICHPVIFYRLRHFLPLMVAVKNLRQESFGTVLKGLAEYIGWKLRLVRHGGKFVHQYKSLRRIVENDLGTVSTDNVEMAPLRKGR
jgi:anaerobic magnesium-protoporphyrin IX monomethyl ester cyclase